MGSTSRWRFCSLPRQGRSHHAPQAVRGRRFTAARLTWRALPLASCVLRNAVPGHWHFPSQTARRQHLATGTGDSSWAMSRNPSICIPEPTECQENETPNPVSPESQTRRQKTTQSITTKRLATTLVPAKTKAFQTTTRCENPVS